jgi:hypothetical protein
VIDEGVSVSYRKIRFIFSFLLAYQPRTNARSLDVVPFHMTEAPSSRSTTAACTTDSLRNTRAHPVA